MPRLIAAPSVIKAAGAKPKRIEEYAWRQGTPLPEGAEYVAVCLPAFSPGTVHRDDA